MLAAKEILYFIVAIATFTLCLCEVNESTSIAPAEAKGDCSCGGFGSTVVEAGVAPLLSQAPGLVVACDVTGEATCKKFCLALATATKAKGPEILCARLVNAKGLKLSAFYKVCDHPWVYADMTAEEPLCCEDSKAVSCPATEPAANVTGANVTSAIV